MAGERLHEDYGRTHTQNSGGSDRSFGLLFAVLFAVVGLWPLMNGRPPRMTAVVVGVLFATVALLRPSLLRRPKQLWMRLSLLLARITNPIVTTLLYAIAITPLGVVRRMAGKDPLRLRQNKAAVSYWIDRTPPGPDPKGMTAQF